MTKNDLTLLIEVLRTTNAPHAIKCVTTWNGFEAGQTYQAELNRVNEVFANDKDGIPTGITPSSCTFFELAAQLPSPAETAADKRKDLANMLTELSDHLLTERVTYQPGQLVEFIPGMDNFKNVKLFRVIEQVAEFQAFPNANPYNSQEIELLDLRVAYMHTIRDQNYLLEAFIDSRRVRLAEGF
jgi:hypothetical protein